MTPIHPAHLANPDSLQSLVFGTPRFAEDTLADLAKRDPFAAWRALFDRGGRESVRHVTGDFAVVLREAGGRVMLAVDRFARHTLFGCILDGQLHVAQRTDQLVSGCGDLAPQALYEYMFHHAIPSPLTAFAGVFRLPAGCTAVFDAGRLDIQRYWTPRFTDRGPANFKFLRTEFRHLLQAAVARSLESGPAACFLSGGTDSSTVAGMVREVTQHPAQTFSIGFDAQGYDEMAYARLAAQHFGAEHHEYYVTPDDLVASIPAVAAWSDQPFGNSSVLPAYYCAKVASEAGFRRMLAGDGGDELFGGNSRYAKQRIFAAYRHVPELGRGALERVLLEGPAGKLPLLRKAGSYVEQARVPMPDRMNMYNLLLRIGAEKVFTPSFLRRVTPEAPLRHQRAIYAAAETNDELNRTLAYDWRYTLAESDLPKVAIATTLAGVEVAYPFLDDALVDFSLRLPSNYKLRGLRLRWFFKEALRGFLPDAIIKKKKQGFGLPFGVWATRHAGLRALALDSLGSLSGRGIIQPGFIRELVETLLPSHPGYYGEMVWILMMLEQWLRARAPDAKFASRDFK